ncbi:MFS transporter [Achromobacter insuavis]
MVAPRPELATTPIAAMFLGTAVATFPASAWMAKAGRRRGFLLGSMLGILGGLIAALGVWLASLPVLSAGTFLVGAYQAFAQFYRFAASEVADTTFRPRAIALVLSGGVIAALLGPTLARLGGPLLPAAYAGSFLILALVSLVAAGVLASLRMPPAPNEPAANRVAGGWRAIVRRPSYLVALFGAVTGYGVMILAMTATPLAMVHHHHELSAASTVIQLHVLGMFLPSFFTGSLIARFGVIRIMLAGVALLASHVFMTWTGTAFHSFAAALVLLGIGWNFLYIGGTTLLTSTYSPAERSQAQAINDMTIFAVGLACSFSAAGLLQRLGWQTLNGLLPWLALTAAVLLWYGLAVRRGRSAGIIG